VLIVEDIIDSGAASWLLKNLEDAAGFGGVCAVLPTRMR